MVKIILCIFSMFVWFTGVVFASSSDASIDAVGASDRVTTILGAADDSSTKIEAARLSTKDFLLYKLRKAHEAGEYLEVSEEDVLAMSNEYIEKILKTQEGIQEFRNEPISCDPTEAEKASIEYYSDEEKMNDFSRHVMEVIRENKGKVGTAFLATIGGLPLLLRGKKILDAEIEEEKVDRRNRYRKTWEYLSESKEGMPYVYVNYSRQDVSVEDILASEAEEAMMPLPYSQLKQFQETIDIKSKEFGEYVNRDDMDPNVPLAVWTSLHGPDSLKNLVKAKAERYCQEGHELVFGTDDTAIDIRRQVLEYQEDELAARLLKRFEDEDIDATTK